MKFRTHNNFLSDGAQYREIEKTDYRCPTYRYRPHVLKQNCLKFINGFSGTVAYAYKANSDSLLLHDILKTGINTFDVASLDEIDQLSSISNNVRLLFMNPIKPFYSIQQAYFKYQVKAFSLDTACELEKIKRATNGAKDLELFVRIKVPNKSSIIKLNNKFGIEIIDAVALLKQCKKVSQKAGICFHVGSQCMDPNEYKVALEIVGEILEKIPFKIDFLNIGGGFPSEYSFKDGNYDSLKTYFSTINRGLLDLKLTSSVELICEPGRALVANTESLVLEVIGRKESNLYLNDGVYGGLFEMNNISFPVRLLRASDVSLQAFICYGPTCDGADVLKHPLLLPADSIVGDFIEVGHMGAYSKAFRSNFNGFLKHETIRVSEPPF